MPLDYGLTLVLVIYTHGIKFMLDVEVLTTIKLVLVMGFLLIVEIQQIKLILGLHVRHPQRLFEARRLDPGRHDADFFPFRIEHARTATGRPGLLRAGPGLTDEANSLTCCALLLELLHDYLVTREATFLAPAFANGPH